jgi:hypothetical protein
MFGTLALPILDVIGKVLDKLIPDADAREKAKAEIMSELARNDAALTQAARDTIVAEAQGESWAQRNWRPMLMFTIMGLLVWTGVVLPLLSAATRIDFVAFVKIVAKIAVPNAPAMFRTKARIEDATPISCGGMVDVAANVSGDNPRPTPNAITNNRSAISQNVHLISIPENKNIPNAASDMPKLITYAGLMRFVKRAPSCAEIIIPMAIRIKI